MTPTRQYLAAATLAAVGIITMTGAIADTASPRAVVEARQEGFKKMGAAMKTLNDQVKQDAPNLATMTAASQVISTAAPRQFQWFPTGTGPESGLETDALEHIWQDRAKFDALANKLSAESKALNAILANDDLTAIKAQVKTVAEVCSTCHKSFRAD